MQSSSYSRFGFKLASFWFPPTHGRRLHTTNMASATAVVNRLRQAQHRHRAFRPPAIVPRYGATTRPAGVLHHSFVQEVERPPRFSLGNSGKYSAPTSLRGFRLTRSLSRVLGTALTRWLADPARDITALAKNPARSSTDGFSRDVIRSEYIRVQTIKAYARPTSSEKALSSLGVVLGLQATKYLCMLLESSQHAS